MERYNHLDGLRGIAALAVVFSHLEPMIFTALHGTYAPSGYFSSGFYLFASGTLAVAIFFVLSGFVLILKFEEGDKNALAIGAVKRYFRLAPPIIVAMIITYLLVASIGFQTSQVASMIGGHDWLSSQTQSPLGILEALSAGLFSPLLGGMPHNGVLWTMNIEFVGGVALFGFAALFYQSRIYWLFVLIGIVIAVELFGVFGIHFSMFLIGSLLIRHRTTTWPAVTLVLIPLGLYLGGMRTWHPNIVAAQAILGGDGSLAFTIQIALNSLGAIMIVCCALFCEPFKKILSAGWAMYLGKISFSLYLVHLPIFFSVGCKTFMELQGIVSPELAATLSIVVALSLTFSVAQLITITADRFGISLSSKIGRIFQKTLEKKSVANVAPVVTEAPVVAEALTLNVKIA